MSEQVKTLVFVGLALVVVVAAVASAPRPPAADVETIAGRVLNEVEDPLTATQLEIVKYDEDTATIRSFEVARVDNRWAIPSHQNYPADAERQMAEAATSVMNRTSLGIVSLNAGDHANYGVIEPKASLSAGAVGVGTRVVMHDNQKNTLVNMIIGKTVKGQEGQRYVREVGKDPVYVVALDPEKLSTDFGDWIEKDLLKINAFDIQSVRLNDYSVKLELDVQGLGMVSDQRSQIMLTYDDAKSSWNLAEIKEFDRESGKYREAKLGENEELDQTRLNDLKTALDDLKIVDVERKPEGLSADLKAEKDFVTNRQALQSLVQRGFIPVQSPSKEIEILSTEGEVICRMKDGVEYLLRFGDLALSDAAGSKSKAEEEEEEQKSSGINRYLFVTARFNEAALEKPKLEEVPQASEPKEAEAEAVDQEKPEQEKEAEGEADQPAAEETSDDAVEEKPAGDAEREKIEEENKRKRKEYDDKVTQGRERVKELNERFGDWYYVISDDVYKKIHLGRKDIVKEKEKPKDEKKAEGADKDEAETEAGDDIRDLKELQQQGLPE